MSDKRKMDDNNAGRIAVTSSFPIERESDGTVTVHPKQGVKVWVAEYRLRCIGGNRNTDGGTTDQLPSTCRPETGGKPGTVGVVFRTLKRTVLGITATRSGSMELSHGTQFGTINSGPTPPPLRFGWNGSKGWVGGQSRQKEQLVTKRLNTYTSEQDPH